MPKTLYRCDGYNKEICGDCPLGESHEHGDACKESFACDITGEVEIVQCEEAVMG